MPFFFELSRREVEEGEKRSVPTPAEAVDMEPGAPTGAALDSIPFSVVIPTYQRAALLGRAIDSALAQTVTPAEIVVIDDGSTDKTAEVVARYGDLIRYVHQANAGCSAARNRGVQEAASTWVAFLDSDDAWLPGHLEAMADAIAATSGRADLYFADSSFPTPDGGAPRTLWGLSDFDIPGELAFTDDGSDWVMRPRQPMKLQCSVFRRDVYLRDGGLDEALRTREDTHFFLRVGLGGPLCAVRNGGVVISFDDAPSNRLTTALPPSGRTYLEATVRLYGRILRTRPGGSLSGEHRRELRSRLGAGLLRLAKRDLFEWKPHLCAWHALRSGVTAPWLFGPLLLRKFRRLLP